MKPTKKEKKAIYMKKWYLANKARILAESKLKNEEKLKENPKKILSKEEKQKRQSEACIRYREKNREAFLARRRELYRLNSDKINQKQRELYTYEKGKSIREKNEISIKKTQKVWRSKNKAKGAAKRSKRRAYLSQRTPKWLSVEHYEQISFFYKERERLQIEKNQYFHVDHIVPLFGKNVSGLHVPWNLQILSAKENLSKGNRF